MTNLGDFTVDGLQIFEKVLAESRNLIGTQGIAEFGPKYGQVFRVIS